MSSRMNLTPTAMTPKAWAEGCNPSGQIQVDRRDSSLYRSLPTPHHFAKPEVGS
jgi:hypothetical protein